MKKEIEMERLIEILKEIKPEVEFKYNKYLVDEGILDSIDIVEIITEIEKQYNITIDANQIEPENFQSIEAMWSMIQRF